MSETKHTPGPWEVADTGDDITIGGIEIGAICRIKNEVSGRPLNDEDRANARLIAAAPELLEALQTVVANAPEPYCAITRFIDAQCRAAIAKATGEQQ